MNLEINKTNSKRLYNNSNFAEKYTNLYYEKCLECKIEFYKNDLVDKKIHITSCDHFFHKACLKEHFILFPKDLNRCLFCNFKSNNYFKERQEIKKNFHSNIDQIYNSLYPNQKLSLKRKREEENEVVGPILKKQRISKRQVIPPLPTEIWEKIWFDQFNFSTPKDICLSLKRIVRFRLISSEWNQIFTTDYISKMLKIHFVASNVDIFEMTNLLKENSLMVACGSKQTELVKILLNTSDDKVELLKKTDYKGNTAFHITAIYSSTLAFLLQTAQSLGLELESIKDDEGGTIMDDLFTFEMSDIEDSLKVIISLKNNHLDFIEKLFSKAVSSERSDIIEFLCDNYLIEHPNKANVSDICMSYSENLGNALALPDLKPSLIHKLIKLLGEFAFKALSFQATDLYEGVGMTPLHYAVQSNLLPSVQAILEAAGPRALELLEIKLERICFFNDLSREIEVQRDLTPLELARCMNHQEIIDYLELLTHKY